MSTKSLGEFEVQYLYNPEVVKITDEYVIFIRFLSKIFILGFLQVPLKLEGVVQEDQRAQPEEGFQVRMARPWIGPQRHQHLSSIISI